MTTRNQHQEEHNAPQRRQQNREPASGSRRDAAARRPARENGAGQPIRNLLENRSIRYDNDLYERQGW